MEKEKEGFPITSLREINTLLKAQHPNIVTVQVCIIRISLKKTVQLTGQDYEQSKRRQQVAHSSYAIPLI